MPSFRYTLIAALALAFSADALPAQFTAVVVPPPKPERPTVPRSMLTDTSQRDTSTARRLQEMSAWVDSAAVEMGIEVSAAESLATTDPADPTRDPLAAADTTGQVADTTGGPVIDSAAAPSPPRVPMPHEFREGAPAPDTATPFPMLALLGASLIGAGALLRRR
jgi:hypothetical protein